MNTIHRKRVIRTYRLLYKGRDGVIRNVVKVVVKARRGMVH